MTDKPDYEAHGSFLRCPPCDAPETDIINWMMHTGCTLGSICTHLARQAGANNNQLALIFTYMYGRALAAYIEPSEDAHKACLHMYELGIAHGKEALVEKAMDDRATAPGTETKQ